jgi:hypothetical protein
MRFARFMVLIAALVGLVSCGGGGGGGAASGGGGGGGGSAGPTIGFSSVTIAGTTDTVCAISANGVADGDATADTVWTAALPMDGVTLPAYSGGASYAATITVSATDTEALSSSKDYHVAIAP